MTPENVVTLFAKASEIFTAIVGQLTDAVLHEIRKVLFPILLNIPYDLAEGKQNLVGIISEDTDYNKDYVISFVWLAQKVAYNNTLAKDANNIVRAKAEATWKAAIANEHPYNDAKRKTRRFILSKVEDTWVRELKNARTYHTKVHAKDLLDHQQSLCLGTHTIHALSPQIDTRKYHLQDDGIPEYINMLKDAQRTALRIDETNLITDTSVLNIATTTMLFATVPAHH